MCTKRPGMSITETKNSWLTRLAFRIPRWYFMEKKLTGDGRSQN